MSTEGQMDTLFRVSDLSVFERHGATVERREGRAGCWITLPNGWTLSVQWDAANYGSNRDLPIGHDGDAPDALTAEIAAWHGNGGGMVQWTDGDTVQGWCTMERVQHVLDLLAADELVREYQPPTEMRADDKWTESER